MILPFIFYWVFVVVYCHGSYGAGTMKSEKQVREKLNELEEIIKPGKVIIGAKLMLEWVLEVEYQ
jgi:hypothetical protein